MYGVVTHTGSSLESGHYISYVKVPHDAEDLTPDSVIKAQERVSVYTHTSRTPNRAGIAQSVERLAAKRLAGVAPEMNLM